MGRTDEYSVGREEGTTEGALVGDSLGFDDISRLGNVDGTTVGTLNAAISGPVCCFDGSPDGGWEGNWLSLIVGDVVGP